METFPFRGLFFRKTWVKKFLLNKNFAQLKIKLPKFFPKNLPGYPASAAGGMFANICSFIDFS